MAELKVEETDGIVDDTDSDSDDNQSLIEDELIAAAAVEVEQQRQAEMDLDHPLVQEVLAATPEEDRETLITVTRNSIPTQMVFLDGLVFVSVLSKIEMMDIHNLENDHILFEYDEDDCTLIFYEDVGIISCAMDNDGHIKQLLILPFLYFHLPAIIAHLEQLERIGLGRCLLLPVELSTLPHLRKIELFSCYADLLNNFPVEMKLNNLKSLNIGHISRNSSEPLLFIPSSFLTWMTSQLPSLEHLAFHDTDITNILPALCIPNGVCFQNTLKYLEIESCNMDDESFETLFLCLRPLFPGLITLHLRKNSIGSVQSIVQKVQKDSAFSPVSELFSFLNLSENPIMEKMKEDPVETSAMLSLLETFNTIENLGGSKKSDYGCYIDYALRKNNSGRRIVVNGGNGGSNNNSDNNNNGRSIVPLSLWPTIIKRAYEKSEDVYYAPTKLDTEPTITKNATGIYYLLREGPVLMPDLLYSRSGRYSDGGNDDRSKNNNNDGGGGKSNTVSSLKRKRAIN